MRQIYMHATSVIMSLPDIARTLGFLSDNRLKSLSRAPAPKTAKAVSDADAKSLIRLCEDEYWYRVWTIQEVLLAKELLIMTDTVQMPWWYLSSFCAC